MKNNCPSLPGASATGDTLRDVPMIKTRSTRSLSSSNARSKSSVSFSPKKVMSGYAGHQEESVSRAASGAGGGKREDLHDPRRVIREIGFIFLTLVIIPSAVLPLFLPRLRLFLRNLRTVYRVPILRITNLAQRHLAGQYILLDLSTNHFPTTLNAGGGGERSVTLKNTLYPCGGFEGVDILGVVLSMIVRD